MKEDHMMEDHMMEDHMKEDLVSRHQKGNHGIHDEYEYDANDYGDGRES